jgi:hypothetical protein
MLAVVASRVNAAEVGLPAVGTDNRVVSAQQIGLENRMRAVEIGIAGIVNFV